MINEGVASIIMKACLIRSFIDLFFLAGIQSGSTLLPSLQSNHFVSERRERIVEKINQFHEEL